MQQRQREWFRIASLALLAGCSASYAARRADQDVEAILLEKDLQVSGVPRPFSLEQDPERLRRVLLSELVEARRKAAEEQEALLGLPPGSVTVPDPSLIAPPEPPPAASEASELPGAPGEAGEQEGEVLEEGTPEEQEKDLEAQLREIEERYAPLFVPPTATDPPLLPQRVFTLRECLEIASANSRDYQREKELVYLAALDLTLQRFRFELQFGRRINSIFSNPRSAAGSEDVGGGLESSYDWFSVEDPSGGPRIREGLLTTSLSLSRVLATGGILVFDFTNSLLRRFTGITFGNDQTDVGSSLTFSFAQPLLQGFGADIVQEPLIQAEREVVYALRSFERFRQEFAVNVAQEYYGLVQRLDIIENNRRSYVQFINAREQSEALRDRGRRSQIETDQAVQSELSARDSWISALQDYGDALDAFKITLGLPMEANLAPDPGELERLTKAGLQAVDFTETEAIVTALNQRLDYLNEVDRALDAERQVRVAADDLRTALDIAGSYTARTDRDTVFDFQAGDATWEAGIFLDLPVDRLVERNVYREALINVDFQRRTASLAEDVVKQEVRRDLRSLVQLRQSYEIQKQAVEVGKRRVESTTRYLRMGRIQIRDALEATDDYVQVLNDLTAALVDYHIAVLEFYRDVGLLRMSEEGIVYEDALEDMEETDE